jgi:hypothetical protein
MDISFLKIMVVMLAALAVTGCRSHPQQASDPWPGDAKIKFRLDDIRSDGLRGPQDGLVSVAYEFCVPADDRVYQEVRRIDSSVQIHPGSSGRIACSKDQALCIGETHQPRWRDVLKGLTSLKYISEIRESFFE